MSHRVRHGTVTGTGAAINVACGFVPSVVHIINETDPGFFIWTADMANAEVLKVTTDAAFVASDGISTYAGAEGATGEGFTIGADADLNAASDVLHWVAYP